MNKVFVVYNGIEDKGRKNIQNVSKKIFKIVSLSRFDYAKNMSLAYDIACAFKDNPNIHFIWVGDGPDYAYLKKKAESDLVNIDFVGFSHEPMKYLKSSDLYLSTSRFEGLPYGLIEASSVGLPIVATNVIGNNEVCVDKVNGFLYTQIEDSIKAINMLYNDSHLVKCMGENSRKIYEEKFQNCDDYVCPMILPGSSEKRRNIEQYLIDNNINYSVEIEIPNSTLLKKLIINDMGIGYINKAVANIEKRIGNNELHFLNPFLLK